MEPADRVEKRLADDVAHGVAGPTVGVHAPALQWRDPGVVQPGRDFRFAKKPAVVIGVGMTALDQLQGERPAQIFIVPPARPPPSHPWRAA